MFKGRSQIYEKCRRLGPNVPFVYGNLLQGDPWINIRKRWGTAIKFYKPDTNVPVTLPEAERIPASQQQEYKEFLGGLAKLINSYFQTDYPSPV